MACQHSVYVAAKTIMPPLYKEQQYSTTSKKYVRTTTTKTKATANKPSRFYYVLPAGKPAPTVPRDQGFYQLLWDDLDSGGATAPSREQPRKPRKPQPQQLQLTANQEGHGIIN
jgi:hypothetical protein